MKCFIEEREVGKKKEKKDSNKEKNNKFLL